ncbi:YccF domain-containing protein [Anaerofilum sp. BX8]|uniref:YccF domain-containing protein n=1 Tax=Anaerofilum hominis TaxID=2763016 RepID=A0A923I7J2_9FIRM|nr:YccF domain-containing protein [Anaerofilum hominis]MBC5581731.1 YccF domain-containing protein [Anaerofilum hominis]
MGLLGNLLWFLLGGWAVGLGWVIAGALWCLTIVGIPIGVQCFKFAGLAFWPFGKEVAYGGGAVSLLANILWLIFSGIPMALADAALGLVFCITIVGIPFGLQCFKLAKLALMPFGASVLTQVRVLT